MDNATPLVPTVIEIPQQKPAVKLFIATPMYGGMCYGAYVQGLLQFTDICRQLNWTTMVSFMFNESLITRARNAMVANFLKSDCTHLFFIDSDIKFNGNEVPPMLQADRDIICGIYPKKEINWLSVKAAMDRGVTTDNVRFHTGSFVINLVNYQGSVTVPINEPVEIWNGGTGFMLIKRSVFDVMKPLCPIYKNDVVGSFAMGEEITAYFDTSIEPETQRLLSEDYHFCDMWRRKCGGKVYAAPWVQLAHNGTYSFEGQLLRHDPAPAPSQPEKLTDRRPRKVAVKKKNNRKNRKRK